MPNPMSLDAPVTMATCFMLEFALIIYVRLSHRTPSGLSHGHFSFPISAT